MADFAIAPEPRDQIVLFPQKLDEAIPQDHRVRLFNRLLSGHDWSTWEANYNRRRGQPPIHPRVIAGLILYGIITRIHSSRQLEEAVHIRNDFRWLVEGHSIDHSTICKFRQSNLENLKNLFVQLGCLARELGFMTLKSLGFDGTRFRANNRRNGSRSPKELKRLKADLERQFAEWEAKATAADAKEGERLDDKGRCQLETELKDIERLRKQVNAALAELEKSETIPGKIPTTDPQSRILPNKEGGFAPNYTPMITVDIESGMIVSANVISGIDEHDHMIEAVDDVKESFQLETYPEEMLADGAMSTGENIVACEALGIELYSPLKSLADNPAERADPSQGVSPADWDRLPTKTIKRGNAKVTQLTKEAFVYDEAQNVYWCPSGKQLQPRKPTREIDTGRVRIRYRYASQATDCAGCPLAARCLTGKSKVRTVNHEQHEAKRRAHAAKMRRPESKAKYSRRSHAVERPFAAIKSQFGVRRFRSRGLERVRVEWLWLVCAFNLTRLFTMLTGSGSDPPGSKLLPVST